MMRNPIKLSFLFSMFILLMCLHSFAQVDDNKSSNSDYTFETIDVPGVDFLAVTASSDFEDYAGYTKSADGKKNRRLHAH